MLANADFIVDASLKTVSEIRLFLGGSTSTNSEQEMTAESIRTTPTNFKLLKTFSEEYRK
jgi:hypothetical protein